MIPADTLPNGQTLWSLLQISDQQFPTGAYTFSHALETYVTRRRNPVSLLSEPINMRRTPVGRPGSRCSRRPSRSRAWRSPRASRP